MTPDGKTRLIVIAGYPTGHIKGFAEYERAIAARGANALYLSMQVAPGNFPAFLDGIRRVETLAGLVLTIPHKLAGFRAASSHDATARLSGAANMLRPAPGGWHASNCDGPGFLDAARAASMAFAGRTVQLLGAGGAGRAIAMAIAGERPARLNLHDVDATRAEALAADIALAFPGLACGAVLAPSSLLVNCTPAGMWPRVDGCPWPDGVPFPAGAAVYDMVYRPARTRLMALAEAAGGRAVGGLGMLARQGAAAFTLWTGQAAPVEVMLAAAQAALAEAE